MGLLLVCMSILQALPLPWRELLRFERNGIGNGEIWRIVTGHYVHLGWGHLALNATGLALGAWVFGAERRPQQWFNATLLSTLACGLGLWWLSPEVAWCVGLSGVLHGLMIVGTGSWILRGEPAGWWVAGLWVLKLGWEHFRGEVPLTAALAGGAVVTDAHLWGAAGGVLYLLLSEIRAIWRRRNARV
jgi:rhomboid family GlyGly-CTERM serine protease